VKNDTANYGLAGYPMTGIPRHIFNLKEAYEPDTGFGGRLKYRYGGKNLSRDIPKTNRNGLQDCNDHWTIPDKLYLYLLLGYKFNEKFTKFLVETNVFDRDIYQPRAIRLFSVKYEKHKDIFRAMGI
jgi:outer membrane receptor protein involved in Fe transport